MGDVLMSSFILFRSTCAGGEERGVGDPEAGHVPALAGLVYDGAPGGGPHARGAHLVRREHRRAVLLDACGTHAGLVLQYPLQTLDAGLRDQLSQQTLYG